MQKIIVFFFHLQKKFLMLKICRKKLPLGVSKNPNARPSLALCDIVSAAFGHKKVCRPCS
jgi:hypothetical protein